MARSNSSPTAPKYARLALALVVILVAGYFGIDLVGQGESLSSADRANSNDRVSSTYSSDSNRRDWQRNATPSGDDRPAPTATSTDGLDQLFQANRTHQSDVLVEFPSTVTRLLDDDNDGDRHQRFLVRVDHGRQSLSILVAHNIDLAERVPVEVGDAVIIRGEYEWNDRGGVIHWTHHNPARNPRHPGGWIEHEGVRYE